MKAPAAAVAGLCLGAALIVSRPLPVEITHGLPVGARQLTELSVLTRIPADTLQLYYQLWLVRDGLLGPTPLFTDPYQFRIDGPRWNLPQTFLPLALPFTVLSSLGLHAAYNLLVLLSFPAAGLAADGLARRCRCGHRLHAPTRAARPSLRRTPGGLRHGARAGDALGPRRGAP